MILHFSHIGFTEARTFIAPDSYRLQDSRSSQESDGRATRRPRGPTGKDSRAWVWATARATLRRLLFGHRLGRLNRSPTHASRRRSTPGLAHRLHVTKVEISCSEDERKGEAVVALCSYRL